MVLNSVQCGISKIKKIVAFDPPYCTGVLFYAKVLKETENEETRLFCQIFVIGGISIEGARATPLATPITLR